jgi:hypothetical protein
MIVRMSQSALQNVIGAPDASITAEAWEPAIPADCHPIEGCGHGHKKIHAAAGVEGAYP